MTADITRLLTMSIADLLDDWFESPQVKGLMAVNGIIGTWAGPCEPGTAYVMAHHSIGDVGDGQLGSWGYPEGGMGGVSEAIAQLGPQLRRRDPHQRTGFPRADPRRPGHAAWCSRTATRSRRRSWSPRCIRRSRSSTTFRVPNCPTDFVGDIEHWKTRSGVVKINVALSELPSFTADPSSGMAEHHTGSIEMAPSMEYIEAAFQDARVGKPATLPFSDGVIPTTSGQDAESRWHAHHVAVHPVGARRVGRRAAHRGTRRLRRPGHRHLRPGRARLQGVDHAPRRRRPARDGAGVRPDRRQHLPRRAVAGAAVPHAARHRATPTTARRSPGCTTAAPATHAGGGVCGIPGWQAARAALADKKKGLRRFRRG